MKNQSPDVSGLPANALFALYSDELPTGIVWESCASETNPSTGAVIPGSWERSTEIIGGERYYRRTYDGQVRHFSRPEAS